MPSAQVTFVSGNWVNNFTPKEQQQFYSEIVKYFTEEVTKEVLEKYYNSVDFNAELV